MNTTVIARTTKGHRVWLQGITGMGYAPRYTVVYEGDTIRIQFSPDGKRKVTQSKGGIVDIEGKRVTAWAQGSDRAHVVYYPDFITVTRK